MMFPTVHLNGTSRDELRNQYLQAIGLLFKARRALADCCPNGRDYYPQGPDAIETATLEHAGRCLKIDEVIDEMQHLCMELEPEKY
jgi:hypothetical protein